MILQLSIANCIIQRLALLKLPKRSDIQLTQITSQHKVTRWVNNRSLIPTFSQAHRQLGCLVHSKTAFTRQC